LDYDLEIRTGFFAENPLAGAERRENDATPAARLFQSKEGGCGESPFMETSAIMDRFEPYIGSKSNT